jgi:rare lipoprotein A
MNHQFRYGLTAMLLISATSTLTAKAGLAQTAQRTAQQFEGANSPSSVARAEATVKVGEQQSAHPGSLAIASIYTHTVSGKSAATLYVRGIPVLTFLAATPAANALTASTDLKFGQVASVAPTAASSVSTNQPAQSGVESGVESGAVSLADAPNRGLVPQSFSAAAGPNAQASAQPSALFNLAPADRAATLAAKLNQLSRDGLDATSITVQWKEIKGSASGQYSIQTTQGELVSLGTSNTIFPETTQNPEQDALQATNRLRRLMGNAAPLSQVQGKPQRVVSAGDELASAEPPTVRQVIKGMASWYGPGFDGNLSASGEVFRQSAMTAAHKSLPFGTRVRVTNLDTGRSVIVRINDRGPYVGDRVMDLSAGAARVIGLEASGVAPVQLEILERQATIAGR